MGRLIYTPTSSYDIEDRVLHHLRIVSMNKLRRREGFMLQFPTDGGGRMSLWISPSTPLTFHFLGSRPPKIDRELVEKMMTDASGADGITLSSRM